MTYHTYWGLPACVLALALAGCSGMAPRAASPDTVPPPWNSLEMIMMDTEIVLIDQPGQKAVTTEPASQLGIAGVRSAS
jgi:hypothetical protein